MFEIVHRHSHTVRPWSLVKVFNITFANCFHFRFPHAVLAFECVCLFLRAFDESNSVSLPDSVCSSGVVRASIRLHHQSSQRTVWMCECSCVCVLILPVVEYSDAIVPSLRTILAARPGRNPSGRLSLGKGLLFCFNLFFRRAWKKGSIVKRGMGAS